jgi:prevent-host-death family protein
MVSVMVRRLIMNHVGVTEFKAKCLRMIEEVRKSRSPLTVTRRGRPVVTIHPVKDEEPAEGLEGTILYQDEDLFSTGEEWEAEYR